MTLAFTPTTDAYNCCLNPMSLQLCRGHLCFATVGTCLAQPSVQCLRRAAAAAAAAQARARLQLGRAGCRSVVYTGLDCLKHTVHSREVDGLIHLQAARGAGRPSWPPRAGAQQSHRKRWHHDAQQQQLQQRVLKDRFAFPGGRLELAATEFCKLKRPEIDKCLQAGAAALHAPVGRVYLPRRRASAGPPGAQSSGGTRPRRSRRRNDPSAALRG